MDDITQNVHISYHYKESQQRENKKIFHGFGIRFTVVFVFCLTENERLVSVAKGLCYHCHDHCYFAGSPINAQLRMRIITFIYIGEHDFIGGLI